jgi:hypothetical protein
MSLRDDVPGAGASLQVSELWGVRERGEHFHRTVRVWSGPGPFHTRAVLLAALTGGHHPGAATAVRCRCGGVAGDGRAPRRGLVASRARSFAVGAVAMPILAGVTTGRAPSGSAGPERSQPVGARPGPRRTDRSSLLHGSARTGEGEPGTPVRTPRRPARAVGVTPRSSSRIGVPGTPAPAHHGPRAVPPVVRRPCAAITDQETVEPFLPPHREAGARRGDRRCGLRRAAGARGGADGGG